MRRARGKVTVVEFAPAGLHVGDSNEALDARAANWARISAPCEGWVPLAALEAENKKLKAAPPRTSPGSRPFDFGSAGL